MGKGLLLHPTSYKVRQYRRHPETGERLLIRASTLGAFDLSDRIRRGSAEDREVIAAQAPIANELTDLGERRILEAYFRGGTIPTNFFLRLYNDTPVDTDTLATLVGEVAGTGYPGTNTVTKDATGWPTSALAAGDWQLSSRTVTWTNSGAGAWSSATQLVLATVASGTGGDFIAWAALSATWTLAVNDSLDASMNVKQA